ncbi:MAG: hypothetical protein KGJ06_07965, partial [Pseudomonadota bacterium]|nr:hypothetical protein [Pseudomonadota bacterium]
RVMIFSLVWKQQRGIRFQFVFRTSENARMDLKNIQTSSLSYAYILNHLAAGWFDRHQILSIILEK